MVVFLLICILCRIGMLPNILYLASQRKKLNKIIRLTMQVINDVLFISRGLPHRRQFLGRQHGTQRRDVSGSSFRTDALRHQNGVNVVKARAGGASAGE